MGGRGTGGALRLEFLSVSGICFSFLRLMVEGVWGKQRKSQWQPTMGDSKQTCGKATTRGRYSTTTPRARSPVWLWQLRKRPPPPPHLLAIDKPSRSPGVGLGFCMTLRIGGGGYLRLISNNETSSRTSTPPPPAGVLAKRKRASPWATRSLFHCWGFGVSTGSIHLAFAMGCLEARGSGWLGWNSKLTYTGLVLVGGGGYRAFFFPSSESLPFFVYLIWSPGQEDTAHTLHTHTTVGIANGAGSAAAAVWECQGLWDFFITGFLVSLWTDGVVGLVWSGLFFFWNGKTLILYTSHHITTCRHIGHCTALHYTHTLPRWRADRRAGLLPCLAGPASYTTYLNTTPNSLSLLTVCHTRIIGSLRI
ncbi:hypothetical protein QBC39DRAFT_50855 [Podospora conica]|nr:hypothetical protein QBC39DRAFT_50855 [Schizothecium conicum]